MQAANKEAYIKVDPQDLRDMEAMLDRMADQESTWQLIHYSDEVIYHSDEGGGNE